MKNQEDVDRELSRLAGLLELGLIGSEEATAAAHFQAALAWAAGCPDWWRPLGGDGETWGPRPSSWISRVDRKERKRCKAESRALLGLPEDGEDP